MKRLVLLTLSALVFSGCGTLCKIKGPSAGTILPPILKEKEVRSCSQHELAPGVTYLAAHFDNLFGDGPVATHWLVIDWTKCRDDISLNISRNPERREQPTTLARAVNPLACVNGTYHSTKDPSIPFYQLKVRGELIPSQHESGDGSMAFNKGEMPFIGHFTKDLLANYENVISGDGIPGLGFPPPNYTDMSPEAVKKRTAQRCPRTFAGNDITNKITVIGIADGRQPGHSVGLSYTEARYLLECWNCDPKALVNLDGGGSTMMSLREEDGFRTINIPSDGAPDNPTERRVAESLQIIDAHSKPDALPAK